MFRGINFGSWLNPEGYILGGRNISNYNIREAFIDKYGVSEFNIYDKAFRDNYIFEADFARVKAWGANVIRVPFHYRLIEKSLGVYNEKGLARLEWVLDTANKYDLKVILDMHAACGAQNCDWHSDSDGCAHFWDDLSLRTRTADLWIYIIEALKDKPSILGYDLINEPVLGDRNLSLLTEFYTMMIKRIRDIDNENIIYLEGHNWSQDIDCLADLVDEKNHVSIHFYQPIPFVFNFRRGYRYPGFIEGQDWNRDKIAQHLLKYKAFADKYNTKIQVGEFGINFRNNAYGEVDYLNDTLSVFNEYGFDWTYWTYKCVAQGAHPDGIMQYNHNPAWIRREGPVFGLENISAEWAENKTEIIKSWSSEEFDQNDKIVDVLKTKFI